MEPIEEYAVIGDGHTMGLISRRGSLDWLCLPSFDSPSCFTALLGTPDDGRWLLGPKERATTTRSYLGDTGLLQVTHTTASGVVRVTDVMPTGDRRADLVRRVEGVEGEVEFVHEWILRPDYGRIRPWVHREEVEGEQVIIGVAGPDKFILTGPRLPHGADGRHTDEFTVKAGDRLDFTLRWTPSHRRTPGPIDIDEALERTRSEQQTWADSCDYQGAHREQVIRSLITLRGMTHVDTGGIVAAPTTSLPEHFGGERNWDYRYCWLRDAALTIQALLMAGRTELATHWRDWLLRAIAGDPEDLQIMYRIDGSRHLPEIELDHLAGYANSKPVRIGNGAVEQRQTDVLGEVMWALADARDAGVPETHESWALQRALVDNLSEHWDEPDNGLWEIRGPQRHFTHSRVMVWVAFDRAIDAVENHGLPGNPERWRELRDAVRDEIHTRGFNEDKSTFTQHYGTAEVDASLLMLPLCGFIEIDDPRMVGTIEAIERDLLRDGFLMRYRTESGVDGLAGDEHPFLACSLWLVTVYAAAGRDAEAEELFDRLMATANDVGLLSEEWDTKQQTMVGNFPQAFSHLALVGAAVRLDSA